MEEHACDRVGTMRRLIVVLIVLNMTIVGLATMVLTVPTVSGPPPEQYHLSYKGRYEHGEGPDHLLGVEMVNGELLVTGALGAYFVDWSLVSSSYLDTYIEHFEPPFNFPTNQDDAPQKPSPYFPKFYGSVTYDAGGGTKYIYVNARYDGIYILSTKGTDLNPIGRIIQNRRFSEGLAIDGDYLYAAYHADGIEIYDLSANPTSPTVVGNITTGFTDAWAVFPAANTLYVADGRGGLKVVDISDKANPSIIWSENPTTSPGNMLDVVAVGGYVYGACGGQGIAVYEKKNAFDLRTITMVNGTPQALALMAKGDIAVAGRSWIHVIRPDGAGGFDLLASERMIRRAPEGNGLMVRIAADILVEGNQIASASWDQVDVYELMDNTSDNQPDVLFGKQMVNFGVDGRSESIKIENQGTARLRLGEPQIYSNGNFQTTLSKEWVLPGDFAWLNITHDGLGIDTRAQITIQTNDPDENPIRFMAYGRSKYVDIGEPMPDFTLGSGQGDFSGPTPEWTFTSFDMSDRVGERIPVLKTPLPDLTMEEDNAASGIDLLDVSGHFTSGSTGKVTFIAIVGSWCPACPPVITSIGYDIYQRYQHRDDFGAYLMSQEETDGSMMHLMEKTKIPGCMIFDEAGNTAKTTLAQYDVNLPFARSYIVDHEGIVRVVGKGYNPQGAWKILDGIFAEIDNTTDLRYEVSYEEDPLILGASGGNGPLFSFVQNQADWTGTLSFKVRTLNSGEDWTPYNSDDMSIDSNPFTVTIAPSLTPETTPTPTPSPTPEEKGRCIIATATFGSELSPEVQFLRGFRDNYVLNTYAGKNFMTVFNAWYYSFSPEVASAIAANEALCSIMKILLYPMIGVLHITTSTHSLFGFHPEFAIVVSGLVASSLIGIVYIAPLALVIYFIKKTKVHPKTIRKGSMIWGLSVGGIMAAEITRLSAVMMLFSTIFVLISMILATLSSVSYIAKYIQH